MKYLKLYENFDNKLDEMVLYLKDILSDIEDDGFTVEVESNKFVHIYICRLDKLQNRPFNFSEIKEAYDRIIIFTSDYGWVPSYQVFPRFKLATEEHIIDKTIIPNENESIYYAELIFKVKDKETNEGLFDFFKDSEDDKIAMSYINRLKKVKGISPYVIKEDVNNHDGYDLIGYDVTFDDTPIRSTSLVSKRVRGFDKQSQEYLKEQGAVRRNDNEFYALSVNCEGDREMVYAKAYILKELNDLCKKVYDSDKDARRIKKITSNMNPAADLNESKTQDLTDDIKDILVDLEDDGCVIDVKYYGGAYGNTALLKGEEDFRYSYAVDIKNLQKINKMFGANAQYYIDVIEPKILQLRSYMSDMGYPHMRKEDMGHHSFIFFAKNNYGKILESIISSEDSDKARDILADLIDSGYIIDTIANAKNFTVRISKVDEEDYDDPNEYLDDCEFTYDRVNPDIVELISQFSDKYSKYTIWLSPSCPSGYDEYGSRDLQTMDEFVDKYSLDEISMVQINFHKEPFILKMKSIQKGLRKV